MTEIAVRDEYGQIDRYEPPSEDQVVELLQLAAAYDRRTFGYAEKSAWTTAARIGGWTFQEAAEAIEYHQSTQSTTKGYLTPGHITCFIRDQRRRRRISGGVNPVTGARLPSHAEAVQLWADEMRANGANPTDDQYDQASSLLAQLLDGAPNPVLVLHAAVLAAKEFNSRIDWRLEKLGKDYLTRKSMPPVPVKYLADDDLDTVHSIRQPDFPLEWRTYDPHGSVSEHRQEMIDHGERNISPCAPTPRNMPAWLSEHLADDRKRDWQGFLVDHPDYGDGRGVPDHLREDARNYHETKKRAKRWFEEDKVRWERERLPIIRAWYERHPNWHRDERALVESSYFAEIETGRRAVDW